MNGKQCFKDPFLHSHISFLKTKEIFLSFLDSGSVSCLSEYTYGTESLKKNHNNEVSHSQIVVSSLHLGPHSSLFSAFTQHYTFPNQSIEPLWKVTVVEGKGEIIL